MLLVMNEDLKTDIKNKVRYLRIYSEVERVWSFDACMFLDLINILNVLKDYSLIKSFRFYENNQFEVKLSNGDKYNVGDKYNTDSSIDVEFINTIIDIINEIINPPIDYVDLATDLLNEKGYIQNGEDDNYVLYFNYNPKLYKKIVSYYSDENRNKILNSKIKLIENQYYSIYINKEIFTMKSCSYKDIYEHINQYTSKDGDYRFF